MNLETSPTPPRADAPVTPSGSHPAIQFRRVPIVPGPLSQFERVRQSVLKDVVEQTRKDLDLVPKDMLLGESLYLERQRLRSVKKNIFTKKRFQNDHRLWNQIQKGLLKPAAEVDRKALLENVLWHYAEEIGGHFDPRVYHLATAAIPFGFSWLLNAASVQRFLPWKMTQSLESRLHIVGEVPSLQSLANRGTILLVPTHQSNIDSVLIGYVIYLMSLPPFAYGAGLNLFSNPLLSFFMSRLGSYTVDRQKRNEIYKHTLKNYSTRILREGIHSIFFPGGGRSRSGAIENKVKLGLLGTSIDAEIQGYLTGSPKPRVFIVPMVTSYHFVLEASSLIEDYLAESGRHKFIMMDDESWEPTKVLGFFWKIFSSNTGITVRIGKPLDVFGNFVDDEGNSLGPNGSVIDTKKWLTTRGELRHEPQRDQEYTRELGNRLVGRFHKENTVLSSHLVAFSFFETLRSKYPDFDLFKFLRLSYSQRSIPLSDFLAHAERYHRRVVELSRKGELYLSPELNSKDMMTWVKEGVQQLGLLHDAKVVRIKGEAVLTEDMTLLYYYRNRLAGYGLSLLCEQAGQFLGLNDYDKQGFLA